MLCRAKIYNYPQSRCHRGTGLVHIYILWMDAPFDFPHWRDGWHSLLPRALYHFFFFLHRNNTNTLNHTHCLSLIYFPLIFIIITVALSFLCAYRYAFPFPYRIHLTIDDTKTIRDDQLICNHPHADTHSYDTQTQLTSFL